MLNTNTQPNRTGGGSLPSPALSLSSSRSPTQWGGWFNIVVSLWWVYLFTLPGSLFRTNPAFNGLAHHAPEWIWSLAIFGAASLSALALLRPRPILCLVALVIQAGIWAGVATCFALSSPMIHHIPVNTGVGVYGAMSVKNMLLACTHGEAAITALYRLRAFKYLSKLRQTRKLRIRQPPQTPQVTKRGGHGVG